MKKPAIGNSENFSKKFEELAILYFQVKKKILITENLFNQFPIGPANEIRNSYDHLFRCIDDENEKYEEEFKAAKKHLKRAGYDLSEMILTYYIDKIQNILNKYESKVITHIIPFYYTKIKPDIESCKREYLVSARFNKNSDIPINDNNKEDYFHDFSKMTEKIFNYYTEITKLIPSLDEYSQKIKRELHRRDVKNIFLGILIAVIAGIALYFIT